MLRQTALSLLLTAAFVLPSMASAQEVRIPVDAIGNVRTSPAPYIQPADRQGRISGTDFSLRCMVSCPSESIDVMEFRSGGDGVTRKTPGRYHAGDVTVCCDKKTLKPILDWFRGIKSGRLASFRKDLVLEILGRGLDGKEIVTCRFNLSRAWPHQINWSEDGTACVQLAVEFTELMDP